MHFFLCEHTIYTTKLQTVHDLKHLLCFQLNKCIILLTLCTLVVLCSITCAAGSHDALMFCVCAPGADIVGVNCHFDPMTCVKTVAMMKAGVEKAGLKAHYMTQPLAYHTPDCSSLEPRILTRWEMQHYAREAYKAGIRYIGGCCGFEPYHIRAVAEELATERGILPEASQKHGVWGSGLEMHTKPWVRARSRILHAILYYLF
uniref:Betaine-homocysteine methyltransferase n=1 Tax=Sinocyclocheilus grahami TaxID=75366 RepID=A0A672K890_SINGR